MWLTMTSRLLGSAPALLFPLVTPFIPRKTVLLASGFLQSLNFSWSYFAKIASVYFVIIL